MSAKLDVVLGLQWGDEGKGKIVDVLASRYPAVARFQGGPNAGHSLHFDGKSFVVRSIPSGIFREGSTNVIGNGVVLDPVTFKEECENILKTTGIDPKGKLVIRRQNQLDEESEDGSRGKLRHATSDEMARLANSPLAKKFHEIFKASVIDARIQE